MSELKEILAELEHKQWIKWSQAIADEVSTSRRARWEGVWIPYSELTEEQKDQDRVWADKALAAFKAHIEECKPKNIYSQSDVLGQFIHRGFHEGIEAYRQALME